MQDNILFLDFDNTLAHSFYADNERHADQLLDAYSEHWFAAKFHIRYDGWYVSFKRRWTDELLEYTRELFGKDNVYILTSATTDYILWCNKYLNLGFDPNTNIFAREDIEKYQPYAKFKDTKNILVDDLSYKDHNITYAPSKVWFLNGLPEDRYIRVEEFTVWKEPLNDQKDYLEYLKSKIKKRII